MFKAAEFINECVKRGYSTRTTAMIYVKNNPKTIYSEEDLLACYRFQDLADRGADPDKKPKERLTEEERMQRKRDTWLW